MTDLHEFLSPINISFLNDDQSYNDRQFANSIKVKVYEEHLPDLDGIEIVIVGMNEFRGHGIKNGPDAANAIRKQLYKLYNWHPDVSIADLGNIICGSSVSDSYAAIKIVTKELLQQGKTMVLLGGSHDLTLGQYFAYKDLNHLIEATVVDAGIDLMSDSYHRSNNFLLEMLTSEPNVVKHYNHIGFQSYFVHPHMLETMDKLRFDCYRVGIAKEHLEEMEPVIRNSNLLSFDISAIKHSDAPASNFSPNGFTGEEACNLLRYAGLSRSLSSIGIFGYNPDDDFQALTAMQISQMLWYYIDGKSRSKQEADLQDRTSFNEFHTVVAGTDTVFLQSKKTGRWWMQLPDKKLIACSYNDYVFSSNNEIPERWLRAQERDI